MSSAEDVVATYQCGFCAKTETDSPRNLHDRGWDVGPYSTYNLCPNCELRDWINKPKVCDAFVPIQDRDEQTLFKMVGPPVGSEHEDR